MTDLKGRKIKFFRAHLDPSIGPMPKNAFDIEKMEAHAEITPIGIYVRLKSGLEHLVPFANIQTVQFLPADKLEKPEKAPRE